MNGDPPGSGGASSPAVKTQAVEPIDGPLDARVRVPGSKSVTNRALVCAALARGRSVLEGALFADDTEAMLDGLRRLGIGVSEDRAGERITVDGCAGVLPDAAAGVTLDARLSGTTSRFLLPVLALGPGPTRLDGAPPLRSRPMADGIAALRTLGAEVVEEGEPGHLPVTVHGRWTTDAVSAGVAGAAGPAAGGPVSGATPAVGDSRPVSVPGEDSGRQSDRAVPDRPSGHGGSQQRRHHPVKVEVAGDASSQFLSGLLLVGPAWPGGLEVSVGGPLVSRPYVDMTIAVMRAFGADVEVSPGMPAGDVADAADVVTSRRPASPEATGWIVGPTGYAATPYAVEPDASAASYFFAAAAICGGRVTVEGLGHDSLQGDLAFVDVLERMGCRVERGATATTVERTGPLHGVEVDMGDLSDTAQTLAVVAVFADSPTRVTGIGFIRAKETDRVGNVVRELRRCGIEADEEPDGYVIRPGEPMPGVTVRTYDDHRMAMSFALLGLRGPGIAIADPDCVAKTFPGYWEVLDHLRK